jgi:hypothetical protein
MFFIIFFGLLIFNSCEEPDLILDEASFAENKLEIVDNRLKFSSTDFLNQKIEELKELDEQSLSEELNSIQNDKVFSLRPLINEYNIEMIAQRYTGLSQRSLEIDADSEFIGDDYFAALVNEEGMLQVRDSIYKYTPFGLFIIHESSLDHLNDFIRALTGSTSNSVNSRYLPIEPCPIIAEYNVSPGIVSPIDDEINYFISLNPCDGGGGTGGGGTGGGSGGGTAPLTNDERIENFINTLTPCSSNNGWWPLGTAKICIDNFTDKSRVKTKFWNQNYLIFRSIGTKVKHQFKSVVWYDADIDELRLGVKSASFIYKQAPIGNNVPGQIYTYGGLAYNANGSYVGSSYNLPNFLNTQGFVYIKLTSANNWQINSDYLRKTLLKNVRDNLEKIVGQKVSDMLMIVEGTDKYAYV